MREDDELLECLEDIHFCFLEALKRVQKVRSVHVLQLEKWAEDLRSQRRIFEDISIPARLIIEHILESQFKGGKVAVEAEHIKQSYTSIGSVKVEEFGIIKVVLGEAEISWRDENYSYYFYPDKIELRAVDEKSAIKLFFTLAFGRQMVEKFPEILRSPNIAYIHPQLEKWLKKVF